MCCWLKPQIAIPARSAVRPRRAEIPAFRINEEFRFNPAAVRLALSNNAQARGKAEVFQCYCSTTLLRVLIEYFGEGGHGRSSLA